MARKALNILYDPSLILGRHSRQRNDFNLKIFVILIGRQAHCLVVPGFRNPDTERGLQRGSGDALLTFMGRAAALWINDNGRTFYYAIIFFDFI